MAKTKLAPAPPPTAPASKPNPPKLPRLPKNTKIHKRPLLHPPLASPRSGASTPKEIYVSTHSPFAATTKRVRTYLSEIDRRSTGKIDLLSTKTSEHEKIASLGRGRKGEGDGEEVVVKATGKAIDRALRVALFFREQGDCRVVLRTGSVGAVDDVVGADGEEIRVRRTSMLEVGISLL